MALRPVAIRLEPAVIEAVAREASHKGVSSAVFIRTAIVVRVAFCLAQRGEAADAFSELYLAAERAVLAWEQ